MKKKITILFSLLIISTLVFGCKSKENTIKENENNVKYEEINSFIKENEEQLLKDNISIGNGYVLVPPSIDIENDDTILDIYVHMNNPKFTYETTSFVNYLITARDEEASYMYSFYEKENGDVTPYIFLPVPVDNNEEFFSIEESYDTNKIGDNHILEFNYNFNVEETTFYVKLLCLEIDEETILMCHRISEDEYDVTLDQAFAEMFDTISITKK